MAWLKDKANQVHVWVTLVISVVGLLTLTGFAISPPWPSKDSIKEILAKLDEMSVQQRALDSAQRPLVRDYWVTRKKTAQAELAVNPLSQTAAEQLDTAERELSKLDRQERLMDDPRH